MKKKMTGPEHMSLHRQRRTRKAANDMARYATQQGMGFDELKKLVQERWDHQQRGGGREARK